MSDGEEDARFAPRASMYLAATIQTALTSSPAKVRNMSTTGALVEAAAAPEAGSAMRLVRGALTAEGQVVWSANGRCGVRFFGSVDVQRWLAPQRNNDQQRVDHIVQLVKAGAVPLPVADFGNPPDTPEQLAIGEQLADHLDCATALLVKLEEALACDPEVVARHAAILQNLDIAMQMVTTVATSARGQSLATRPTSKLNDLRRSADQALNATLD